MPGWDFAPVKDDVNPHILRILDSTISLGATQMGNRGRDPFFSRFIVFQLRFRNEYVLVRMKQNYTSYLAILSNQPELNVHLVADDT